MDKKTVIRIIDVTYYSILVVFGLILCVITIRYGFDHPDYKPSRIFLEVFFTYKKFIILFFIMWFIPNAIYNIKCIMNKK